MPMWTTLTLEQLQQLPLASIVNDVANWLKVNVTKREMLEFLVDTDTVTDPFVCEYNGHGKQTLQIETYRDVETGLQTRKRIIEWVYYDGEEVDEITITDYDGDDIETDKHKIKHYKDGRQPEVIL